MKSKYFCRSEFIVSENGVTTPECSCVSTNTHMHFLGEKYQRNQ